MTEQLKLLICLCITWKVIFGQDKCDTTIFCEENSLCVLTHIWENIPEDVTITWHKDDDPVCNCRMAGKCKTLIQYSDRIVGHNQVYGTLIENKLFFLPNALEADQVIKWSLTAYISNSKVLLCSWQSRFYRKIIYTQSYIEETQPTKLTLVFESYPNCLCLFTDALAKIPSNFNVDHAYAPVPHHPYHVISYCSLPLIITKEEHEYSFRVTAYPNLTSLSDDLNYGIHVNVHLKIDRPKVAFNCKTNVNEGERINCACTKSDASNLTTEVRWYNNSTILAIGNDEALLDLKAELPLTDFICVGSNSLGWKSKKMHYKLTIRDKVDLKTFSCPDKRQQICGRHGLCFYNYEFCTKDKKVESCFPNVTDLLEWCREKGQYDTSLMRDKQCGHACISRFGLNQLLSKNVQREPDEVNAAGIIDQELPKILLYAFLTLIVLRWKQKSDLRNHEETST
ncbi:uncharacterized protein LOC131930124 isoform X2 [Physella acuta]|uniref:uncharacterized protein LOC131930124 isoform X2 n=1 Tax=Physella acuta TaxID=109671 RepID=UPI0027DE340A|nr:uncharacterized protein LOC131930124 isoform X2 [Physella acuta]